MAASTPEKEKPAQRILPGRDSKNDSDVFRSHATDNRRFRHPALEAQAWLFVALVAVGVSLVMFTIILKPLLDHRNDSQLIKPLTVTAYSPTVRETDSTPLINACNESVAEGQIAVSNDLWLAGWVCGKRVWVQGRGIYRISDRMNRRFKNRVDIFFFSTKDARRFGHKTLIVALLAD